MDAKRYINEILRLVKVDRKTKRRLREDLSQDVEARLAQGASLPDVIREMGEPFAVAAAIQEDHEPLRPRTVPEKILLGFGLVFAAVGTATLGLYAINVLLSIILSVYFNFTATASSVGIIGGADGPTAIFVTSSVSPVARVLLLAVIAGVLLLIYALLRKRKNR